jgi:hypothetical protein
MRKYSLLLLFALFASLTSCKKEEEDSGDTVATGPSVSQLWCDSANLSPLLILPGTDYAGLLSIPYSVGNGFPYKSGLPVFSTGVTGLKATLRADTLNRGGSGDLLFDISGIPSGEGKASFEINFGINTCVIELIVGEKSLLVGKWNCINTVDSLTFISATHGATTGRRRAAEYNSFLPAGSAYFIFDLNNQFSFNNNPVPSQNYQGTYVFANYLLTLNKQGGSSINYPVMYVDSARMKLSIATGLSLFDTLDVAAPFNDSIETYSVRRSMNLDKIR